MDDITSFSHRKLSTILKNPDHPHHAAAKAERDRRAMQRESVDETSLYDRIKQARANPSPDKPVRGRGSKNRNPKIRDPRKALDKEDDRARQNESKDEFEPHMMYDPKTGKGYMARKPADHDRMNKMGYTHDKPKTEGAMKRIATTQSNKADRTADGGKKGLETFKKREMQKETKGAPKGYHFTRDGKLRKGDAGADGDGGAKLRSDPLDKQRSKIPPLPEKFANAAQQAAVMAKLKKSGKYDAKEGLYASNQTKRLMSPLQKARLDKEKADRDRDGKLINVKSKPKMEGNVKSFSEISMGRLNKYAAKSSQDVAKNRNTVKVALDQPASPKHAKAGMDAMKKLHKRSRGSDMYVDKVTGRSKVKPTAEETVNELDKKTLGSYIKKAGPDAVKQTAQAKRHSDAGDMADKDRDMYKHYAKSQRAMDKAKNRTKGINKAVDKLTREATIPDGQTAMTKRPELTNNDKDKLAKIRKMLDREKKK